MSRPRLDPVAEVEALLYLESQREGYGERFEAEVDATLDRIGAFPLSGALVEGYPRAVEARAFPLRRFRYSLMVALEAEGPVVYAVAHQNRRPDYWHDRSG